MSCLADSTAFGGACHTSPKPPCGYPWVSYRSGSDPNPMPDPENPFHETETPLWAILGSGLGMCGYQARVIRYEPGPNAGPVRVA